MTTNDERYETSSKLMPRGHALRKGRVSKIGELYHVTFTTHDRKRVFVSFIDARKMIAALRDSDRLGATISLAFVVMPDHVHWLFELQSGLLSNAIARVKSQFSRTCENTSSVWQSGFHDHAIRREEEIEKIARYIVENPMRAGLVHVIGEYPHWDLAWL